MKWLGLTSTTHEANGRAGMNVTLDPSLTNEMLVWAQLKLDALPTDEFGGDWWGAYNDSFDLNIWYDERSHSIRVTAYPMTVSGDDAVADMGKFISIGQIDVAVRNYDRERCGRCDREMSVKWGSTYPHRQDEYGVVCGLCWNELTYGGYE